MVTLLSAQSLGIVGLALILSGVVIVENIKETYICAPEDNVKECYKVSSTGITCYTITGNDRCTNGKWVQLEKYLSENKQTISSSVQVGDIWYIRDPDGKVCYEYGSLRRPASCPS